MALSDCIKCWDIPCTCGYNYRDMDKYNRLKQASVILGVTVDELMEHFGEHVPREHPKKEK